MNKTERRQERIVFWCGLLNPIFLCWVWGGLSAFLRLCRYGNVMRNAVQAGLCLLACILWLVVWLFVFRRWRKWLTGKYSTRLTAVLLAEVAALTVMLGMTVYRTWQYAGDFTTKIGWRIYEATNTVVFSLSHDNLYTDGSDALIEELREELSLPEDVYVSNLFQIDFTDDGTVVGMYAFLYGADEAGTLHSWLIDYQAEEEEVTVWLDNAVTASFDEGQQLQPMVELLERLDLQTQAEAMGAEKLTLRYYGVRSDYPVGSTLYLVHEDGSLLQITAAYTGYELLLTDTDSDEGGRIYFADWISLSDSNGDEEAAASAEASVTEENGDWSSPDETAF
ncbi:MAG: hypothetical protein LIO45_07520 [Clostridiales bacterium]|nr:hypothetical protein [Clostridiales bacterium]